MSHFHIVKNNVVENTFRTSKLMADYDIKAEHSNEVFEGDFDIPDQWSIGVIYGSSGTGKTTLSKELFGDAYITEYQYSHRSVIDDMPKEINMNEIEKMFYSVGFGSVPSWLKPYNVLSNGEKMRVNLARALLQNEFVVFDEFTSVVDRQVAKTMCIATNKAIHRLNKQFVAVTCHKDVIEWLSPDWVFNTDTMQMSFMTAHARNVNLLSDGVGENNGQNLGSIII